MCKKIAIIIFSVLYFIGQCQAEIFKKIIINGNQKISSSTIKDIINFDISKNYNLSNLNQFQKILYDSKYFKKVEILKKDAFLYINLVENPFIDFFYINGVENKQREEFFYENLSLGQNKIFSEVLLKKDVDIILNNLNDAGYYNAKVEPRIAELDGNVINLVLDVNRGKKYRISNIFFIGNKNFSASTLSDVVSSSRYGWWKFLSNSSTANNSRIDYDATLLKKFYLERGYFDIQIISKDIKINNKNQAEITFSINPGQKYYFEKGVIIDNEKILSNENFQKVETLILSKLKNEYSADKIDKVKGLIYDYLNSKKVEFFNFTILQKKLDKNLIKPEIIFTKSKRQFVDFININGNSITEEEFIRSKITFAEGDAFENYKLNKSIKNLKSTGVFKEVKTNLNRNDKNETITVNFDVEEQPTGSISAGLGIGTAGSTISSSLTEKNLFGKGINLRSILSLGTEKINADVDLSIPDFKYSGNTLNTGFYAISTDYKNAGYESSKFGSRLGLTYDLFEDVSFQYGLGLERDSIDVNSSASKLYKDREGNYNTIQTFYSVVSDKRNNSFLPTSGHKIGLKQSLGLPGSDIPFLKNSLFGSYYYPATKKMTVNVKGGIDSNNALSNSKNVKLSDRLFLTSSKLRGFESFGVGPKDGKDHIGGNYSYYTSISSTIPNPLPEKWNANTILFLDTGNVWGVDFNDSLDSNKIRSSFGAVLEWISPLGPVSFTFSEAISQANGDLEENFNFVIGSTF